MDTALERVTEATSHIAKNLWPLYVHDISAFQKTVPNVHGILGLDDEVRSLGAQGESQEPWFRNAEHLFPYIIRVKGRPSGFNFIATGPYLPEGPHPMDFVVYDFFLLHEYRGTGAAEAAAVEGFDRHRGRWEVATWPSNQRAILFWRRLIDRYTHGEFDESTGEHVWGERVIWRFDNRE